jgi:hypothetical protein
VRQVPGRPVAPRRVGGGGLGAELSRPAIFAERAGQRRCAQQLLLNRSVHSGIVICVQAPWASRWMRDTPHAHSRAFCLKEPDSELSCFRIVSSKRPLLQAPPSVCTGT